MSSITYEKLIEEELNRMHLNSRFPDMLQYMQHGKVSVYEHCINVAYMSCRIAIKFNLKVNYSLLIRGALLHDYFLYDWHEPSNDHKLHGFHHSKRALKNAREDFNLTPKEDNIILRHMFPLTPIPPNCLESWIVCLADKISAIDETFSFTKIKRRCFISY